MSTTTSQTSVIEATGLRKAFPGGVTALDGLDLRVQRGSVYALLGRNGCGKTTTLRILLGLLAADRGTAHVLGCSLMQAPASHRQRVAYVAQTHSLHSWMTLREHCHYVSHFYRGWSAGEAERLAGRFELPLDRRIGHLSGGQQRKAAILLAMASDTEVLVLDEPAAGLDPVARRQLVDELVDSLARDGEKTVILATHIVSDVERLATHVGILERGRMEASGPVEDLQHTMQRVQIIFGGDRVPDDFELAGALRTEVAGPVLTGVVKLLSDSQLDYIDLQFDARVQTFPLGLEDILVEILGDSGDNHRRAEETLS